MAGERWRLALKHLEGAAVRLRLRPWRDRQS